MLKSHRPHYRGAVGEIVGNKNSDVIVGESKKCGFDLIWFNVYSKLRGHLLNKIGFVFRSLANERLT